MTAQLVDAAIAVMNCRKCQRQKFRVLFDIRNKGKGVGERINMEEVKIAAVRCTSCGTDHLYDDGLWS